MKRKSNLKVLKFFDQRNLGSIPRIFISSLALIFFFYSMPIFINYAFKDNNEFQNNSKAILAYTLNNDGKNIEIGTWSEYGENPPESISSYDYIVIRRA